jgi:RNA polymerase sigma-70 factor (ECF subfamily)
VALDKQKSVTRAQLMERAQTGDREAFHILFREAGPLVTRFLRRHLPDREEIEDVCQEALLAVYKSRHTYQPGRPFEPWLFAIVRNVSAEHLRRKRVQWGWPVALDEAPELDGQSDSSFALELSEALERLSPNQREALSLTQLLGLSLAEASRRAGTTIGSMKVRIHRAHQSLKRSLIH